MFGWRRRILVVVCGLAVLVGLGVLVAKPLLDRRMAKTGCDQSNGKWNSDARVCDYGPGGAVVRLLEKSKRCEDVADSNLRKCAYSVERLKLDIIGVGTSSASVAVDGSDDDLGYGVAVFMGEGCIRVAPGTQLKERDPMRRIEDRIRLHFYG